MAAIVRTLRVMAKDGEISTVDRVPPLRWELISRPGNPAVDPPASGSPAPNGTVDASTSHILGQSFLRHSISGTNYYVRIAHDRDSLARITNITRSA
jgi:hypothetical protein